MDNVGNLMNNYNKDDFNFNYPQNQNQAYNNLMNYNNNNNNLMNNMNFSNGMFDENDNRETPFD